VRILFNLGLDLKPFYKHVKRDAVMLRLTRRLWGLKSPTTATVFEALVDSIVEQQISLNVAHVLQNRIIRRFGDALRVGGEAYYAYPTPKRLASTAVEQLRNCGLTQKKAEHIKNLSKLIENGQLDLEKFKAYKDTSTIVEELDQIKGIGVWTAELTIVRSMQKFDVLPADDIALKRVIAHCYCHGRKITGHEVRRIAEKWGSWRGLAAYYLEVAERLRIEPEASSS
jgi:DNA-3-methyladenine glycosylase II